LGEQAYLGRQQTHPIVLESGRITSAVEDAGGLKLIYIDPPFDVGADFSVDIETVMKPIIKRRVSSNKLPTATLGDGAPTAILL